VDTLGLTNEIELPLGASSTTFDFLSLPCSAILNLSKEGQALDDVSGADERDEGVEDNEMADTCAAVEAPQPSPNASMKPDSPVNDKPVGSAATEGFLQPPPLAPTPSFMRASFDIGTTLGAPVASKQMSTAFCVSVSDLVAQRPSSPPPEVPGLDLSAPSFSQESALQFI